MSDSISLPVPQYWTAEQVRLFQAWWDFRMNPENWFWIAEEVAAREEAKDEGL